MIRLAALILLFSPALVNAQTITARWTAVVEREDGTPIDPGDLIYAIMDRDVMQEMCVTSSSECTFYVGPGECGSLYAVAHQISTGLHSAPSNVIDVCADELVSRLNSPVLEYIIGSR